MTGGRPPVLLGIDLGTTHLKAGLVTVDGELLGITRATYPLDAEPETGRAEQDPELWWLGLVGAVRELTARTVETRGDIVGISVAGQGPTLTLVDEAGQPVRPAISWRDTRAVVEAAELERATGLHGWALGVLPAARWVERHDPLSIERASWYLNTWDALALRLTGRATAALLPGQELPSRDVLREAGLAAERIAPRVDAGTVVGELLPGVAGSLGLPSAIPVVAGVVDAFASFHGAGMVRAGDAIDVGGAAGGFGVYWDRPVEAVGSFAAPAPLPGLWSVGGAMAATGTALEWWRDSILGGDRSIEALIAETATVAPGADGVVFLPYLAGERSPIWDPEARGAFVGLSLSHGRAHLTRAILEAAAFAIRHVAAPILDAGVRVTTMRACGGPARSPAWSQIKADVTGFPVEIPRVLETAVVGAAIVAAVGVGAHPDLPTAIGAMTAIERRLEPTPDARAAYDRAFRAYVDLYPALRPVAAAREGGGRAASDTTRATAVEAGIP